MNEIEQNPPPEYQRQRPRHLRTKLSVAESGGDCQKAELPKKSKKPSKIDAPTKAETALLPPFPGLPLKQIIVPVNPTECEKAVTEILAAGVVGFDTEAKPTFRKGQKCDGPHVVQFALTDKAFILQLHRNECAEASAQMISSKEVLKVGFGLKNDHTQIRRRFGIELNHVFDLDQAFKKMGYRGQIGVRGAMGVLRNQCFKKSKATTTSNWSLPQLTSKQLAYAANDAYAALKIWETLREKGQLVH